MTDDRDIKRAASIIRDGGLVAFPTETVYGVGADALNPIAVARIFEVKGRPQFYPLIVHIAESSTMQILCPLMDKRVKILIDRFWPGPLTLILPKSSIIPDIVTAGLPTVGVRMPAHPLALKLILEANTPIAGTSANPSGCISPTTSEQVLEYMGDKVDMIIEGGRCKVGIESTILDITKKIPVILREGGIPIEEIETAIGKIEVATNTPYHRKYTLKTSIKILKEGEINHSGQKKVGILLFKPSSRPLPCKVIKILSPSGDLREAAANFFSYLRILDEAGLDIIYVEPLPDTGLGKAIMDRILRSIS